MREKLIAIIKDSLFKHIDKSCNLAENIADDLLENGVVVLPCEVGQIVYFVRNKKIITTEIEKIIFKNGGLYIKLDCNSIYETSCKSIGKTVFLSREDAERALRKEGEGK